MSLKEVVEFIVSPVFSGLILAGILWLFNVPKALRHTTKTMEVLSESLEHLTLSVKQLCSACEKLEKRVDITDRVLSDLIGEAYDSKIVSEDKTKYPKMPKRDT